MTIQTSDQRYKKLNKPGNVQKVAKSASPLHVFEFFFDCETIMVFTILANQRIGLLRT